MIHAAIAFHAERLHDDRTWSYVERAARWMERRNIRATFFVYPFRAVVAGKDIKDRVRVVAALGHEIGQHTHFYRGVRIDKHDKVNDLSRANIDHCLRRDFEALKRIGVAPKAFTAGAWLVNPTVRDSLVKLQFVYDCSAQFPKPNPTALLSDHSWLRSPRFHSNERGRVLCLPTTCSLGEWFKWGRRVGTEGALPYQLVYLHDYDLLSWRNRLLLSSFLHIINRRTHPPLAVIAQRIGAEA
jgi:peptidoglycan/xylan/chitin deacetylase (PgdA/CDA1 family)